MEYTDLLIEQHGKVVVIRLNRPKAMNALNDNMMNELGTRCMPSTPTRPSTSSS
jgi:enoyl-CoA hydratase/carnithine racemase